MQKQVNPINETTDDARALARQLIRTARFGAIGVLQEDGTPLVSRILVGTDTIGNPIILISDLSEHTKAIKEDNRVSLLLGEPKKGDPVAHPRISVQGKAIIIPKHTDQYSQMRARFIAKHPKSELYIGFADFQIYRIDAVSANLNAGFGKAFHLSRADILSPDDFIANETKLSAMEQGIIETFNNLHANTLISYTTDGRNGWRLIGIDCNGFELANGDDIVRREFKKPMSDITVAADVIAIMTDDKNLK